MIVKDRNDKRKGNQRPKPPVAGGKRREGVLDRLRAVKSYNLILQKTSTPNVLLNRPIFTCGRISKKLHVMGTWRLIILLSTFVSA